MNYCTKAFPGRHGADEIEPWLMYLLLAAQQQQFYVEYHAGNGDPARSLLAVSANSSLSLH